VNTPPPEAPEPEPGSGRLGFYVEGHGPPAPPDLIFNTEQAEEGGTSRITLRLPDHLKPRIDEAAGRAGLSVNAWLVRVVAAALDPDPRRGSADSRTTQLGQRFTGWVR
jgi:hypothetical protein